MIKNIIIIPQKRRNLSGHEEQDLSWSPCGDLEGPAGGDTRTRTRFRKGLLTKGPSLIL